MMPLGAPPAAPALGGPPSPLGAPPRPPLSLVPPPPPQPRMLTKAEAEAWRRRIHASLDHTKQSLTEGKKNVQRYQSKTLSDAPTESEAVVPSDFWFIEQKKAGLFYRLPDIFLRPMQPGKEDGAVIGGAAMSAKLGPQGLNVLPRVKQVLFDVLCATGYGAMKVGFDPALGPPQQIPTGASTPNPARTPGAVLGLSGASDEPLTVETPHIIAKRYFAEHVSPGDLGAPADFVGLDFDDAAFLFVKFREDVKDGGASDRGGDADDDRRLSKLSSAAQQSRQKQRIGYEVWYHAARFDEDAWHPEHIRMFVLYEDDAQMLNITVKDSPYQRWTKDGQTTPTYVPGAIPTGMVGFPISPLTLRFISDAWLVPSDCTMARNTADNISRGWTQMLRFRDRSLPQYGFDSTRVDQATQDKIARNDTGAGIPFNGPGEDATWPIQKGRFGRESFEFHSLGMQILQMIWGQGANQVSATSEGSKTATELQIIQAASATRQEQEREAVVGWYLSKVATKIFALYQLFADEEDFVELVGTDVARLQSIPDAIKQQAQQQGQDARVLVPWNKDAIQGRYAFQAKANSQLYLDAAQYRKQLMDLYNFFANEPTVNRAELVREILQTYGFDPSKMLQQPPAKQSPPPQPTLSFNGADVDPLAPQSPIVLEILQKLGIPIDPAVVATALAHAQALPPPPGRTQGGGPGPAEHGGAAQTAEPLSKHPSELTGNLQGSGAHAPVSPGGHLL